MNNDLLQKKNMENTSEPNDFSLFEYTFNRTSNEDKWDIQR